MVSTDVTIRQLGTAVLRWLALGLGSGFAAFQGSLLVLAVLGGLITSGPTTVVYGTSMEPAVRRGDIVLNERIDQAGVTTGAVVVFASGDRLVTHRIVDRAGGKVQTKGDASLTPDSTWQPVEALQGRARLVVPLVGLPRVWVREANWLHLGLWALAALAAFEVAFRPPTEPSELEATASTADAGS